MLVGLALFPGLFFYPWYWFLLIDLSNYCLINFQLLLTITTVCFTKRVEDVILISQIRSKGDHLLRSIQSPQTFFVVSWSLTCSLVLMLLSGQSVWSPFLGCSRKAICKLVLHTPSTTSSNSFAQIFKFFIRGFMWLSLEAKSFYFENRLYKSPKWALYQVSLFFQSQLPIESDLSSLFYHYLPFPGSQMARPYFPWLYGLHLFQIYATPWGHPHFSCFANQGLCQSLL